MPALSGGATPQLQPLPKVASTKTQTHEQGKVPKEARETSAPAQAWMLVRAEQHGQPVPNHQACRLRTT